MIKNYLEVVNEGKYLHQRMENILLIEGKMKGNFVEMRKELDILRRPEKEIEEIKREKEGKKEVERRVGNLVGYQCASNLKALLVQVERADTFHTLGAPCPLPLLSSSDFSSTLLPISLLLTKKLLSAIEFVRQRSCQLASRRTRLPSLSLTRFEDRHNQGNLRLKRFFPPTFQTLQTMAGAYATILHKHLMQHVNYEKKEMTERTERGENEGLEGKNGLGRHEKTLSLPHMEVKSLQTTPVRGRNRKDKGIEDLKAYVTARKRDILRGENHEEFREFNKELVGKKRELKRFIEKSGRGGGKAGLTHVRLPGRAKVTTSSVPTTACVSPVSLDPWPHPLRFQGKSPAARLAQLFC